MEGAGPGGGPKRACREIVEENCWARVLNGGGCHGSCWMEEADKGRLMGLFTVMQLCLQQEVHKNLNTVVVMNVLQYLPLQEKHLQMNILRLVVADKETKAKSANLEFQKLEAAVAAACKDKGVMPVQYNKDELQRKLSLVEYFVTQEKGTER